MCENKKNKTYRDVGGILDSVTAVSSMGGNACKRNNYCLMLRVASMCCLLKCCAYVVWCVLAAANEETDKSCDDVVCGLNSGRKKGQCKETEHLVRLVSRKGKEKRTGTWTGTQGDDRHNHNNINNL